MAKKKKFPLTECGNGQFRKIINGKRVYFGSVKDPAAALRKYYEYLDNINREALAPSVSTPDKPIGKEPAAAAAGFVMPAERQPSVWTVEAAGIAYLKARQRDVDNGRLSPIRAEDCRRNVAEFIATLGADKPLAEVTAFDYTDVAQRLEARYSPGRTAAKIAAIRTFIRWAVDYDILATMPKFGNDFVVRKEAPTAADRQKKVLSREEVLKLMAIRKSAQWRAIVLLGINCALGNEDIAQLRMDYLDLGSLWLDYPRPKTGVARYAALWPETAAAIREYAATERPRLLPRMADTERLFATRSGTPWTYITTSANGAIVNIDNIRCAVSRAGVLPPRVGFYALRHTFRTVADRALDKPAIDRVMGHAPQGMDRYYMGNVDRDRIERVCNAVREWLFHGQSGKENRDKLVYNSRTSVQRPE